MWTRSTRGARERVLAGCCAVERMVAAVTTSDAAQALALSMQLPWSSPLYVLCSIRAKRTHIPCCSVAMVFMPNDDALEAQSKAIYERIATAEGFKVLGWREVPIETRWVLATWRKAAVARGARGHAGM